MAPRKAAGRPLRAVTAADKPPVQRAKPKPKTVVAAAESSERDLLVALRTMAAKDLDSGTIPAHARPTMMKQLRELDKEIRAMDERAAQESVEPAGGGVVDDSFDAEAL